MKCRRVLLRADRRTARHTLHLPVRGGGDRPAGRYGRRDRADASPARRDERPDYRRAEPPPPVGGDAAGRSGRRAGNGPVMSLLTPNPFASSVVEMPIVRTCRHCVSTSLDTNGIHKTEQGDGLGPRSAIIQPFRRSLPRLAALAFLPTPK